MEYRANNLLLLREDTARSADHGKRPEKDQARGCGIFTFQRTTGGLGGGRGTRESAEGSLDEPGGWERQKGVCKIGGSSQNMCSRRKVEHFCKNASFFFPIYFSNILHSTYSNCTGATYSDLARRGLSPCPSSPTPPLPYPSRTLICIAPPPNSIPTLARLTHPGPLTPLSTHAPTSFRPQIRPHTRNVPPHLTYQEKRLVSRDSTTAKT